jgi:Sensors of blue-light using FAD
MNHDRNNEEMLSESGDQLTTLVYMSHAGNVFKKRDERQKLKIHAQTENAKRGITGMLIYCEGLFLQVLEGEAEAVNRLYSSIFADPRHTGVELLCQQEITSRLYHNWAMGYIDSDTTLFSRMPTTVSERIAALRQLQVIATQERVDATRFIGVFIDPALVDTLQG